MITGHLGKPVSFLELIERKRDGYALAPEQITAAIQSFVKKEIPDYQMAAFLMAVYFRGFNGEETRALTMAMRDSGEKLQFPADSRPLVDKHSTGGVGDKVSLVLAPLLACLGFRVPMISGRGLGITGGTLDKLESIPGFASIRSREQIIQQVQSIGCIICSQTEAMVPADKELYALRDVTGTVPSIPLITASILSKKLAEDLSSLLLDVKFGSGAFMKELENARRLAESMVELANASGLRTRALLTGMNTPTGTAVGNWLEVKEAVACLEGHGTENLRDLVLGCATHLLVMEGKATGPQDAKNMAAACLASRQPRLKFDEMLLAQGSDLPAFNQILKQDTLAGRVIEVRADRDGYISQCDARIVGEIVRDLGGGRTHKNATVDPTVGIDCIVEVGRPVKQGELLCRVHAQGEVDARHSVSRIAQAFLISDSAPASSSLISEVIGQ